MRLFITIEAQNCTENGLAKIMQEINDKLKFITDRSVDLENQINYGTEFRLISIIPSCMDDSFWNALGWKERIQIWRKKGEADIRLRMDYERFISSPKDKQRLIFTETIIKSIQIIQTRSKGDFKGNELIKDILSALNVSINDLNQLNI